MDQEQIDRLTTAIGKIEDRLTKAEASFARHQHSGQDGSSELNSAKLVLAPSDSIASDPTSGGTSGSFSVNMIRQGNMGMATSSYGYATSTENNTAVISVGSDKWLPENFGVSSLNTEFNIQDLPGTTALQSFVFANRKPSYRGSAVTFTSAATTFTDSKQNWTVNELTGGYVTIYSPSDGSIVETRKISSNTAHVVTVDTAFGATSTSTTYVITAPVYLGSADFPWRRAYVGWDTDGGVRFGYGKSYTGAGVKQTGLLYMSSTDGTLNYRNPAGTVSALGNSTSNGMQAFTSSGTFTTPAGVTKVFVRAVGGGGGSAFTGESSGGGGYCEKLIDLTGVATVTVTIGAGGVGGNGSTITSPTAGGDTTFGAYFTAGGGGTTAGGTASGGDINIPGGNPDVSFKEYQGATNYNGVAGRGGNSMFGQGGRSVYSLVTANPFTSGVSGTGYGSGASGSAVPSGAGANGNGANGKDGILIVTW